MQAGNKDASIQHLASQPILEPKFYSHIYTVTSILYYSQQAGYINLSIWQISVFQEMALESFL